MKSADTPFEPFWWGMDLELAGLDKTRPRLGTYGRYDHAPLPALPVAMKGDFAWLAEEKPKSEWAICDGADTTNLVALLAVPGLPKPFVEFCRRPDLQKKIRSATACFLDFSPGTIASPIGGGRLVRFLADQQGCLFWYLWLPPDRDDHAIVCSTHLYAMPSEDRDEEPDDADPPAFSEESFESFMCRYWLENEIFFILGDHNGREADALPKLAADYIELYKQQV